MAGESEVENLLSEARIMFEQSEFQRSLELLNKAYAITPCPKVLRKIERVKAYTFPANKENETTDDVTPPSSPVKEVARHLIDRARDAFMSGQLNDALRFLKESYECVPCEKTAAKIRKVQRAVQLSDSSPKSPESAGVALKDTCNHEVKIDDMINRARELFSAGELHDCLRLLQEVQSISPSEAIQRKIDRIKSQITDDKDALQPDPQYSDMVSVADGFLMPSELYEKLYPYQREGVRWLWHLHNNGPGGVLADDMGLGKTVQVIAFLSGLFISRPRRFSALVIMPVSVLVTWEAELKRWAPALRVVVLHDIGRVARLRQLSKVQHQGGIVLTTYGLMASSALDFVIDINANPQFLRSMPASNDLQRVGREFTWNYVILDEAHKIKNPSAKTTKGVLGLTAEHRILLTGTAVQNNLRELWSLYNFTHSGRLLGRLQTFSMEYEKPIARAREKDASRAERVHGQLMAQSLRRLIDPYFLRRTKAEILPSDKDGLHCIPTEHMTHRPDRMPKKTELVVWLYLRDIQERSYRDFLQLDQVKALLVGSDRRSPLMELVILKKLCDHPRLLSADQCTNLNLEMTEAQTEPYTKRILPSASQLADESGKLMFLSLLMNSFLHEKPSECRSPPRTLIFSQSLRFLDMAEKVILDLNNRPENLSQSLMHRVLRLDGRLNKVEQRLEVIRLFERDPSYTVMLLTVQVGGVGLTLTAANRVVILDPSWNPATDAQAVDRAYRIGQKSDVIVYRLLTCGTVEEKIYRRQIFKDSVIRQTTCSGRNKADADPYRYFTRQDLRELFSLTDARISKTQQQLAALHSDDQKWSDESIRPHLLYLTGGEHKNTVFGLSFHDLMFSRVEAQEPVDQETAPATTDYITSRLRAAEHAIARENADAAGLLSHDLATMQVNDNSTARCMPADGIFFVPSKTDSKRPILNRPHLGGPPMPVLNAVPSGVGGTSEPDGIIGTKNSATVDDLLEVNLQDMSISHLDRPPKSSHRMFCGSDGSPASSLSASHRPDSSVDRFSGTGDESNAKGKIGSDVLPLVDDQLISSFQDMSILPKQTSPYPPTSKALPKTPLSCVPSSSSFPLQTCFKEGSLLAPLHRSTPATSTHPRHLQLSITPLSKSNKRASGQASLPKQTSSEVTSTVPHSDFGLDVDDDDEAIHMDITAIVDDRELARTVDMKSVHAILTKSGLLASPECNSYDTGPSGSSGAPSVVVVEDSYCSQDNVIPRELAMSVVNESADVVEIIEDSFVE
ncbi:DNA excision repair protein ERCC-6 [Paragonimus heterotremus]|uniref:DNA excision repair protein ERCC-6 n=1 Tax=Paragonimus heterotremus TaxID=100268 RepID=A0A8J4SVW6_9TREM|nr:DNA excision repair protein ERCC-6 [Paragonimus heterotremus]